MCLQITVRVSRIKEAVELDSLGGRTPLPIRRMKRRFRKSKAFNVGDSGCACSLLSDEADWNAASWDMLDDARQRLADTVMALAAALPEGFEFEALWIGERSDVTRVVTARELADLCLKSHLGTKTRYEVMRDDTNRAIRN